MSDQSIVLVARVPLIGLFPFPIWNTAVSPRTPASDRCEKLPGARIYIEDCFDLSAWVPWDRGKCPCYIAGNGDFGVGDS